MRKKPFLKKQSFRPAAQKAPTPILSDTEEWCEIYIPKQPEPCKVLPFAQYRQYRLAQRRMVA